MNDYIVVEPPFVACTFQLGSVTSTKKTCSKFKSVDLCTCVSYNKRHDHRFYRVFFIVIFTIYGIQ